MGFGVDPGSWTSWSRAAWPSSSWCRIGGEPCAVQPDAFVIRDVTPRCFWLVNWFRRTPEHQRRALVDELAGLIHIWDAARADPGRHDVSEIKEAVASAASGERSEKVLIVRRR